MAVDLINGFYYPPIGNSTAFLGNDITHSEYRALSELQYGGSGFNSGGSAPEGAQGFTSSSETEPNNRRSDADFINVGTADSSNFGVAVSGTLNPTNGVGDEDYFIANLQAGDIFDVVVEGAQNASFDITLLDANGRQVLGNTLPVAGAYPTVSPLTQTGNANFAVVIPSTGQYYVHLTENNVGAPAILPYTLTMRAYRPVLESASAGEMQTIFLDFDGENIRREHFGAFGLARLSPLVDFLPGWNLTEDDEARFIDKVVAEFATKFYGPNTVTSLGGNGDVFATGIAGQFGVRILNSKDHADPWGDPNVSRVIIGGTQAELQIPTIGIAQSIDVGNFDTEESAVVLLDNINALWGALPRAADVPLEDVLADGIASVAAHEVGHYSGAWHTLNNNASDQIMDTGGNVGGIVGVGDDGIYGTDDDDDVGFGTDTYDPAASAIPRGRQDSAAAMAWGLSSGKTGGAIITGTVFNDVNPNSVLDAADAGLAGIRVYADADNDGVFDSGEYFVLSGASGVYNLTLPPGSYTIRQEEIPGYTLISAGVGVNLTAGQSVTANFANRFNNPTVTGSKWNDANGNGVRDANESPIEGVWIYIDEDGDNRIDIGEPATKTAADGTYTLNFPGPGTYTIREVLGNGFVQTFPGPAADNEHTITLTGDPTADAAAMTGLDFGNRLTVDYGDAPASYGVARHGFISGLYLGDNWDAEEASQHSANALGDDNNGSTDTSGAVIDDEDGVILSRPLVAGSTNNRITVTAANTTGSSAYLSGWIDYNQNGTFEASEKIISDAVIGSGSTDITFSAPANAVLGDTFARFRYSSTTGLTATGEAGSGEVEDYVLSITDTLNLAVDDAFTVNRNSALNSLDVLANDFRLPGETLEIISVSATTAGGIVQASSSGILYTPLSGFIGQDSFTYTMRNSGGDIDEATVIVDVRLSFDNPVAIDDSFNAATNAIDFPLNVLANDIEGQNGALTIISVTQPDKGGQITIATGGKSLRYTPARDFGGTEFFTYTVADSSGAQSSAQVTVHTLPGDRADDDILIQLIATDLSGNPISAVQQGDDFRIEMRVDDLRFDATNPGTAAGVFAAYTDLLYSLQLVSTVPNSDPNSNFNFETSFFNDYVNFQTGDATIPGIIDEFGAFSDRSVLNDPDPTLLATITFNARSPGIAAFTPDPADNSPFSDSLLFDTPGSAVPIEQIRYIGTELEIVGDGVEFPVAIDDSLAQTIPAGSISFPIDVLANDLPGSTGVITIVSSTSGLFGTTLIDNRGTSDPSDDRVQYTPNAGFNGSDQFTYTIQDNRGIQSTATVTVRVGDADADDIVGMRLSVTDLNGQPVDQITVGSQFQLRGFVQDLRGFGIDRGVFAAYEDVLYSAELVSPVPSSTNDPDLGFQVQFGPNYQRVREGDIRTPGVINEIGAVQIDNNNMPLGSTEQLLFIVTLTANSTGIANFVADPADISPLHDTLTFEPPAPVGFEQIRYGFDSVSIVADGSNGSGEFQNPNNRFDVNADGEATPIDALIVANYLNRNRGSGEGEGDSGDGYFRDVSGDNVITPLDVLMVVNHLNTRYGGLGEGEGEFAPAIARTGDDTDSLTAPVSGELVKSPLDSNKPNSVGARLTDNFFGPAPASNTASNDSVDHVFGDADDDLEALLSQIAPSIETSWKKDRS